MEGKKVDKTTTATSPAEKAPIAGSAELIWPQHLIAELARARRPRNLPLILAIIIFAITSVISLLLSLGQLILIALFQDYEWVSESFFPSAANFGLTASIILGIFLAYILYRANKLLREDDDSLTPQPVKSAPSYLRTLVYAIGTILLSFTLWLATWPLKLSPQIFTVIVFVLIVLVLFVDLCLRKQVIIATFSIRSYKIICIALATLIGLTIILDLAFFIDQNITEKPDYAAIATLTEAQTAAHVNHIPDGLSNLVFALCENQPYQVVIQSTENQNSGIFECKNSHEVYSVTGPIADTNDTITGQAFYFGTTYSTLINRYFPPTGGARYLYRDLAENAASELVLLLPAESDENLIEAYLPAIANLMRERDGAELLLSIFYNTTLSTVLTTKDYLLITALDTITTNDYLPNGNTYRSIIGDGFGTYKFVPDNVRLALAELGSNPSLYPNETREAINSHRHITVRLSGVPSYDELREQLFNSLVDPIVDQIPSDE